MTIVMMARNICQRTILNELSIHYAITILQPLRNTYIENEWVDMGSPITTTLSEFIMCNGEYFFKNTLIQQSTVETLTTYLYKYENKIKNLRKTYKITPSLFSNKSFFLIISHQVDKVVGGHWVWNTIKKKNIMKFGHFARKREATDVHYTSVL